MPPKRKASKNQSSGGSDDEDYRKKRDRNNQVNNLLEFFFIKLCINRQAEQNDIALAISIETHFLEYNILFLNAII